MTKGVRFESAFMAIAQNSSSNSKPSELPSMVGAKDLPSLTDIPGVESAFSDPLTPIRYLGLCIGAGVHLIRSLVLRGRYLAELYLSDKDPIARKVALATLQQIAASYPASFAPELRASIQTGTLFNSIPQDVTQIDPSSIITLARVNLVIASPDCQPFSAAGNQQVFSDLRSSSFHHCLRVIKAIHTLTSQPITYVIENVPGAGRYRSIIDAVGLPLKVSAHLLGSVARRETLLWTNAHPREFLQSYMTASLISPPTFGDFLI